MTDSYSSGYSPSIGTPELWWLKSVNYPPYAPNAAGIEWRDEFARASLNPNTISTQTVDILPTGYGDIYTGVGTGTEVIAMTISAARTHLRMQTGATSGNDCSVRMSEYLFERGKDTGGQSRNAIRFDTLFSPITALNVEGFIGFVFEENTALTALPAEASQKFAGIQWDAAGSNVNFFYVASDGNAFTLEEDSGVQATASTDRNLLMDWTGNDALSMTLTDSTVTGTTTDIGTTDVACLHYYVEATSNAGRTLDIINTRIRFLGDAKYPSTKPIITAGATV